MTLPVDNSINDMAGVNSIQKIDELNESAWKLRYENSRQALEYADEALENSKLSGYEKGIAIGLLNTATIKFLVSDHENYPALLLQALDYFNKHDDLLNQVKTLHQLGAVQDSFGNYDEAIKYCLKSLSIAEELGYKEGVSMVTTTLGLIYSRLSDYKKALEHHFKSLAIREETGDLKAAASSLNLIARNYSLLEENEKSLEYYRKSFDLRKSLNDNDALLWTITGMASVHEKMQKYEEAEINYLEVLKSFKVLKASRGEIVAQMGLGKVYSKTGKPDEALIHLTNALKISVELNSKPLIYQVYAQMANVYELTGNYSKAYDCFKKFHDLKEEVFNTDTQNKISQLQISFETEKSEKEAEIHRLKNVELKAAFDKLEEKNKEIQDSINYALRIQDAILQPISALNKILPGAFIILKPKDVVSGDFYWFTKAVKSEKEQSEKIILIAADCTGHGVPGAFMSMIGTDKLNHIILEKNISKPSEILGLLNKGVRQALKQDIAGTESKDGMEMGIVSLAFNNGLGLETRKVEVEYAGAGRPLYIVRKDNLSEVVEIKPDKLSIGGCHEQEPKFTNHTIHLNEGDKLYMFSDGYPDQFGGEKNKKITSKRLKELLLSVAGKSMVSQEIVMSDFIEQWKGKEEQTDDILLMGIKI